MPTELLEKPNREQDTDPIQKSKSKIQNPNDLRTQRYHIMTWGCQMNEEDSEQIGLFLERMGYEQADSANDADVVLLNTCSVRAKPEEKVWSELGKLREIKKERPDLIIGVCGCMAQVESLDLKRRAPQIDLIVGTNNIAAIPKMIHTIRTGGDPDNVVRPRVATKRYNAIPLTLTSLDLPPRKGAIVADIPERVVERKAKIKAHVPIMYGCDKFCTFCIVPYTRGRERSRPTAEVLSEIEALALNGTKEVTLLGQTVNSYGKNLPEGRVPFAQLLEKIDAIKGISRIRFTSPYPKDFTDELIETIGRLPSVCEHIHLPLQVGDDELLAEMHRGYDVARFREIVAKLRASVPGVVITTDIMLGYPGETDQQFQNTLAVVEELQFDSAFMFAYSPRPNTKAAAMENQLPKEVKVSRLNTLIELQNNITMALNRSHIGETFEVLVEGYSHKDKTKLFGYTRGLRMMVFTVPEGGTRTAASLIGKTVPVKATDAHLTGFSGEYVG